MDQPTPATLSTWLPAKWRGLRMLAQARRLIGIMLPMGAMTGFSVAMVVKGLDRLSPAGARWLGGGALSLALPVLGLSLTTYLLSATGIGPVSLSKDLEVARRNPYEAFPFWKALVKLAACGLTIGFGGSAGIEGPGKWFGSAFGVQVHRLLKLSARFHPFGRRMLAPVRVIAMAGAGAALAAVFRAPLTGALMAAEDDGVLHPKAMIPCLVASATGYLVFSAFHGLAPLIPIPHAFRLRFAVLSWSIVLGVLCGLAAPLYLACEAGLARLLGPIPFRWRGLAAGVGLALLAAPAHWFWHDLNVTQGGVDLVIHLLQGTTLPSQAVLFFALKLAATALTFAGGGIGGKWLPAVAMGAALGAGFDAALGLGQPGILALLGGSALAGALHQSLLVPVLFLAETTGEAALVVPGLVGTTVAYLVAQERARLRRTP